MGCTSNVQWTTAILKDSHQECEWPACGSPERETLVLVLYTWTKKHHHKTKTSFILEQGRVLFILFITRSNILYFLIFFHTSTITVWVRNHLLDTGTNGRGFNHQTWRAAWSQASPRERWWRSWGRTEPWSRRRCRHSCLHVDIDPAWRSGWLERFQPRTCNHQTPAHKHVSVRLVVHMQFHSQACDWL